MIRTLNRPTTWMSQSMISIAAGPSTIKVQDLINSSAIAIALQLKIYLKIYFLYIIQHDQLHNHPLYFWFLLSIVHLLFLRDLSSFGVSLCELLFN